MKNYIVYLLVMIVVICGCPVPSSAAEEPKLYAKAAVLMDADTGRVLYGRAPDEALPMASTTKIMTLILALEYGNPDDVVTVSSYAAKMPEVRLGLHAGDRYVLQDLLYSMMLESHNDSACAVAEQVGGSVEAFAQMMNRKAAEIGLHDTYFITPNGLDSEDENGIHSTTARDLATIMAYCIKNQDFLNITQSKNHTFTSSLKTSDNNLKTYNSYSVSNSNAFLDMYDNVISGKTGFTGDAGYCYVCAYRCDGRTFIVALMACGWPNNKTYKWKDTRKLLDYARNTYYPSEIVSKDMQPDDVIVENGNPSVLHLKIENNNGFTALLSHDDKVNVSIHMQTLSAPVISGETVGEVRAYINDEKIYSLPITAANTIKEKNYVFYLKQLLKRLIFIDKS